MKMIAQPAIELEYTKRHGFLTAQAAVRDIYDALVELITNSDDSYHRMGKDKGDILIEVEHRALGLSRIVVKDRAEGMNLDEFNAKIRKVGKLFGQKGDRSFMGRGVKDCAVLGKVTIESVKDEYYHKCEVLRTMDFVAYKPSIKATDDIRRNLSILVGNGTVVTIEIENDSVRIPRHDTLLSDLPWHFALRDIMNRDTGRRVLLRNLNTHEKPDLLMFTPVEGETIFNDEFEIDEYPGITAHLIIKKAKNRIENPLDKRFRRNGVLVKGERGIHEVTFFSNTIEQDSHSDYLFGELSCPYIDQLCREYDDLQEKGLRPPHSNQSLIIDPNRQSGLRKEHEFTKALFKFPIKLLLQIIASEREKETKGAVVIENQDTRKRLDKLAKAASKFLQEKCDDTDDQALIGTMLSNEHTQKQAIIIPDKYVLGINEIKSFGFRVYKNEDVSQDMNAHIKCDSGCIRIITPEIILSTSPTNEKIFTGYFKLQGINECDFLNVEVSLGSLIKAQAKISVVKEKKEIINISNGFAFEREIYRIKENKKKVLILRVNNAQLATDNTQPHVFSNNRDIIVLGPPPRLIQVDNSDYSEGHVTVQGRQLGANGNIFAQYNGLATQTKVQVTSQEEKGIPLTIDFTQENIGVSRAKWDYPLSPNRLLIAINHPSLKRYIGPAPTYVGQNEPHFKLLTAEIVAENIVYKILEDEEKRYPGEFSGFSVQKFYSRHDRHMRDFLPIAHEILLTNQDLQKIPNNSVELKLL